MVGNVAYCLFPTFRVIIVNKDAATFPLYIDWNLRISAAYHWYSKSESLHYGGKTNGVFRLKAADAHTQRPIDKHTEFVLLITRSKMHLYVILYLHLPEHLLIVDATVAFV